jgi:hypothetical protein
MKRYMGTAIALAMSAGWMIGAAAQTSPAQTSGATKNNSDTGNTVTVTGCVQDGSGAMNGATGGSSTASGSAGAARSASYVLAGAMMSSAGGSSRMGSTGSPTSGSTATTGTSGTAGSTAAGSGSPESRTTGSASTASGAAGSTGTSYMLEGHESELKNHVGHRVEITGTTTAAAGAMTGGSATAATGTTSAPATGSTEHGGAMGNGMTGGHLRVSSIKMISSDCSGSGR